MITVSAAQRRARLGVRHGLASPAIGPVDVADQLVVLHASDPATVFLSVKARIDEVTIQDVERELYEDRTMFRTLAMRRTLFVASREIVPLIESSSSGDVARTERASLQKFLINSNVGDPKTWLDLAFEETLEALEGNGGCQAREITRRVPRLRTRITIGSGKHSQETGATSRVLGLMAVEGLLARGRPAGAWTGRQYGWHRRDEWLPLDDNLPTTETASVDLVRLWLQRFGPGTLIDISWWTGWTKTKTRQALESLDLVEVSLEGGRTGYVLADDVDDVDEPEPWVALLPSLDPTAMGWKERDWYVGEHSSELFDRNGNIGPTVWANGRIIGGWSVLSDASVSTSLFRGLSGTQQRRLDEEVRRLESFLEGAVVKPSFPTPLQKRLSAGTA